MVATNNSCGYPSVKLMTERGRKTVTVHRLVARAFIPNDDGLPQVNHKDGDKTNNSVGNLEWCTASQNTQHAYDHGLKENTRAAAARSAKARHQELVEAHIKKSSIPIEVTELATGRTFRFSSANEAARSLQIEQGNLSAVCRGRIKSTAGYAARYLEKE
jgi:hypothetical protein